MGRSEDAGAWSAQQYATFEDERTRPVRDLLAAVPAVVAHSVIDLGCGPGNSTEQLGNRFAGASISGIDGSADMVAAARRRLPAVRFEVADIGHWLREEATRRSFDVILANAVLQWLPHHDEVFPALTAKLAQGGVLAVQMPDNLEEPAHRLMRATACDGPWAGKLHAAAGARSSIGRADWYYALLRRAGCKVDIWRTTYCHALAGGAAAVVQWFEGSGLRPFLAPLDDAERTEFLRRYQGAVAQAYPQLEDGSVLLPFPRLFIVAQA